MILPSHQKHDVVEHFDLDFATPHAEPLANLKLLDMAAALVKAHLAEIVVLCLDFDRYCAFAVASATSSCGSSSKFASLRTLSRDRIRSS